MARAIEKLTAKGIEKAKKPGYYGDGAGLYLQVSASGSKSWIFRYKLAGKLTKTGKVKNTEMGLGAYPTFSLAEARERAGAQRKLLADDIDPIAARTAAKQTAIAAAARALTFEQCASRYIGSKEAEWKSAKHAAQWRSTLASYAGCVGLLEEAEREALDQERAEQKKRGEPVPTMGAMWVKDIDLPHVLETLEPIWRTKTETASRLRSRIELVLDWATAGKYREGPNPARWRGHLDKLLPRPSKVAKVEHHPALPIDDMGAFMERLRSLDGMGARALEFAILTAARSGEVRGATWREFDLDAGVWKVPAARMKAGREHRIPLSAAAVSLLRSLPGGAAGDVAFPGVKGQPLSDMTLTKVCRRMDIEGVPHGFRSTFRDWTSERTSYPHEMAEMALAHAVGDKVEAAYRRGDLFEKRRRMMEDWANFIAKPIESATVVPIAAATPSKPDLPERKIRKPVKRLTNAAKARLAKLDEAIARNRADR
jgi:integrase